MKKIIAGIFMSCFLLNVHAQNQLDIYRYSNQSITGSARTLGLSGAWGAVGADLSAASFNPAGLGLYRRNDVMGALSITSNLSKTEYSNNFMSDSRTVFNIPNLGVAFNWLNQYKGRDQQVGVVSLTGAFGMNRINDFQSNIIYSGNNSNTSIANYLAKLANGTDTSAINSIDYDNEPFAQAWRAILIDNPGSPNTFKSIFETMGDSLYTVRQGQSIQTRGRVNEWYVGGGMNISNLVYLGASLVFEDVKFSREKSYNESVISATHTDSFYNSMSMNEHLISSGFGVGGKFGIIIRPVDFFRFGFSYQTPVRIRFLDSVTNTLTMNYNNGWAPENYPGYSEYTRYEIVTPSRFGASAAVVLGKLAVIAADYEMVDYSEGRLQGTKDFNFDYSSRNNNNKALYDMGRNYKIGAEIAAGFTRIRVGYALLGSPYNTSVISKTDGMKHLISAGFGWVYEGSYFFDFSVSDRIGKDILTPYEGNTLSATNTTHKLNFVIGGGYRF